MNRKLYFLLSFVVVMSLLLGACSQPPAAATQPADQPSTENGGSQPAEPEEPSDDPAAEPTQAVEDISTTDRKGAWLDRIIFTSIPEVEPAVAQLEAGTIDLYAVSAEDAAAFETVTSSSDLQYSMIYGSTNQMLFNTEACSDSSVLNPYSSAKIREAMNWAVDRNYIAEEIMGGLARPKYVSLTSAFPDYARYADIVAAIETKYGYDLEKAKVVVSEEMTKLGAELDSQGKWTYQGKPVTLIGLIRIEDRRKEIGNYFANQMEALGFTVDRQEKSSIDAGPIWQQEDPANCKFNFYTAGWIAQEIQTDEGNMFVQYNTGKMQTMPVFNAYDPSTELLTAADRLYTGDYTTMDERRDLFETALNLSMEESWWGVWVTDNIAYTPYLKNVEGASDLAAGFASSSLYPYTLRFEGQEGGEIRVAQADVMVEPWNPVAGSNWVSDGMIMKATMDWGLISGPYTGVKLPKLVTKAEMTAVEGLPIRNSSDWLALNFASEIPVPEDAWVDWDAKAQRFITAAEKFPEGATAKTKSVVYYTPELWNTTWHDGNPMTIADFVMNMILAFDPGKPESAIYDESLVPSLETYLTHFKGVRIVSSDPLVIETYEDQYLLDAENSLTSWYPSQYVPTTSTNGMISWHHLVPAMMAEANGEMAFSTAKATEKDIDWTSLLAGPTLEAQAKYLDQALAEKYIPYEATLGEYITPEDAAARYQNLKNWFQTKKHLWIGTGPYFVDEIYPVEKTITVSRYGDYLFPADQFSGFGEPKIASAIIDGPITVQAGTEAAFDVIVSFGDEAYPTEDIQNVAYILFNAGNEVLAKGEAESVGDGVYQVVLDAEATSKLEEGGAKLSVAVSSSVVSIPAFASYQFVVTE